jgi:hypothetical protein
MLNAWFPNEKTSIVRMDSFSSNKGKELRQLFLDALVHGEFSPPGQHAFLGDLERWWYTLFVRGAAHRKDNGTTPCPGHSTSKTPSPVASPTATPSLATNVQLVATTSAISMASIHLAGSPSTKVGSPTSGWNAHVQDSGLGVTSTSSCTRKQAAPYGGMEASTALSWAASLYKTGSCSASQRPRTGCCRHSRCQRMTQRFRTPHSAAITTNHHSAYAAITTNHHSAYQFDQADPCMCQTSMCRLPGQLRRVHVPHMR